MKTGFINTIIDAARRFWWAVFLGLAAVPVFAGPAGADPITIVPTGNGAIGTTAFTTALNWVAQYGLYGAAGGMLIGGGMVAYSRNQGGTLGGSTGQKMILGGVTGAFVIGLAGAAINLARSLGAA